MRTALLLGILLLTTACGGAPTRPVVVRTEPANEAVLGPEVQSYRITFDVPVKILSPASLTTSIEGVSYTMVSWIDPDDPKTVVAAPVAGQVFTPGWVAIKVGAGLVTTLADQYALEDYWFGFRIIASAKLHRLSSNPPGVVEVDAATAETLRTVSVPGGRRPLALVTNRVDGVERVWVQLENGGGTGAALAVFEVGAKAMTPIPLTCAPGSDLLARHGALALAPDGRSVYAAFRDASEGRLRVCRIEAATSLEQNTLQLSVAPSASTWPLGLSSGPAHDRLTVTWTSEAGAGATGMNALEWQELP